ncbi:uncharacterized protein TNCV_834421 [Trichonephila clavipes]|nr:uncharacterized protein TNCV_834421 [Trichonephila clavipes]
MLRHIKNCTEEEAHQQLKKNEWPTILDELDAFISILYHRGIYGANNLELDSLWCVVWGSPFFCDTMWTGYHRLWPTRPLHQLYGQRDVERCGGILPLTSTPVHGYHCPQNKSRFITDTNFCQSVTFHIDLAWHHCRRRCQCSGVKRSAQKGRLDSLFASARCLEIVCGTIATPTSARIVERVTVGSTSACRTILRASLLVVFLVAPDPVFSAWVLSRVHCSQQFLKAYSDDPPGQQHGASTSRQFLSR